MNRGIDPKWNNEQVSAESTSRELAAHDTTQNRDLTDSCLSYQEQSWNSGERCLVENLVSLFPLPIGPKATETLLALICNEKFLREAHGETPTLSEYQNRFPDLANDIQLQWEIDDFFDSDDSEFASTIDVPSRVKRVGRYEVLSELGRGAMGVVYLAWDPELKRNIAIKRLRTGTDASSEEITRIRTEAEAVAQLQHPNIVQIYDVGEDHELPFLAMEYCHGGTLAKRLDGKPILPRLAAELIVTICKGVSVAHQRRIIHRDLKPKNVLLERGEDWSAKVSDFGLAKLLDNDSAATATGNILGTPAYMSPEQAFGDAKRVGPAADVYSLGAILYECLTGRPPFLGVTIADTLEQVRQREPLAVRKLEPRVPLDLETITHKCLRKDPTQRYLTVVELEDDLSRFLNRQPILARRERWYEAVGRLARKHPLVTMSTTASALLLIAVTAVSLVFAKSMMDANVRIRQSEVVAKLGQASALVSGARGIRVTHEPGQRFEALAAIRQAAKIGNELDQTPEWFDAMRNEAIAALTLPDAHISQFRTEEQKLLYSDFSDDHRLLALSFETGPTSVRRLADHHELAKIPRIDSRNALGFVGNDHLFQAGMQNGAVELWNLEQVEPKRIWQWTLSPNRRPAEPASFKAINAKFAVICDTQDAFVLSTFDGSTLAQFALTPYRREPFVALHPTHPYLIIYSYFEPSVELRNWETGETIVQYRLEGNEEVSFSGATWSHDGRHLALVTADESALIWFCFDPESGQLKLERKPAPSPYHGGGGPYMQFNVQGDRLLFFGWNQTFGLVDANLGLPLFSSHGYMPTVACKPKVDPLETFAGIFNAADESKKFGMMSIAFGRERTFLQSEKESGGVHPVSDPTGRILAFAVAENLNIMDVATKKLLLSKRWPGIHINALFFDDHYFYISSNSVCLRFPYSLSVDRLSTLNLGLPERVHIPPSTQNLAASRDGKTIAVSCYDGSGTSQFAGCWAKLESEPAARKMIDRVSGYSSAVSNSGKMIGFSTNSSNALYVQNSGKIEQVQMLPHSGSHLFSDDERWILKNNRMLTAATLQPTDANLEGALTDLTSDGKQVASYENKTTILSDAMTGNVFARFEGGHPQFLGDGSKVVNGIGGRLALHDMKLIRKGVLELGIPWTGPDYANCVEPEPVDEVKFVDEMENVETGLDLLRVMDQQCEDRATMHPEDGHLAFSAAMISIDRRDWEEARERLDRSCLLLPDAITPRQWRAYLLAEMRLWPEAIADASWVLAQIEEPRFRLMRAEWLFRNHEFERSIEECTAIIENNEELFGIAHGLRHFNHVALGNDTQANQDREYFFNKTLNDVGTIRDLLVYPMVGSDISLRRPMVAKLYTEKLRSLTTEFNSELRNTIGLVCFRNDEYSEAMEILMPNLADTESHFYPHALSLITMSAAKLNNRELVSHYWKQLEDWQPTKDLMLNESKVLEKLRFEAMWLGKRVLEMNVMEK